MLSQDQTPYEINQQWFFFFAKAEEVESDRAYFLCKGWEAGSLWQGFSSLPDLPSSVCRKLRRTANGTVKDTWSKTPAHYHEFLIYCPGCAWSLLEPSHLLHRLITQISFCVQRSYHAVALLDNGPRLKVPLRHNFWVHLLDLVFPCIYVKLHHFQPAKTQNACCRLQEQSNVTVFMVSQHWYVFQLNSKRWICIYQKTPNHVELCAPQQ